MPLQITILHEVNDAKLIKKINREVGDGIAPHFEQFKNAYRLLDALEDHLGRKYFHRDVVGYMRDLLGDAAVPTEFSEHELAERFAKNVHRMHVFKSNWDDNEREQWNMHKTAAQAALAPIEGIISKIMRDNGVYNSSIPVSKKHDLNIPDINITGNELFERIIRGIKNRALGKPPDHGEDPPPVRIRF